MKSLMTILVPFIFSLLLTVSTANVPQNATFRFVNEGFFDEYSDIEYGATYRSSSEPKLFTSPFVVCYYNTTPGVYTLALRMGGSFHRRTTLLWVWEANRGKPVGENAVFALRNDGNLVLTHADGRLAWQTNTANKGVTGFKLLPNGNMILHDAKGKILWQSFDFPTDTLLIGQSLHVGVGNGTNKLVSRLSDKDNKDGPYTLALETKGSMSLYFKSSLLYYASADFSDMPPTVTFEFNLDAEAGAFFFTLGPYLTARAYHNTSLSFLRLGVDGNLRIFTYNEGIERRAFITAYTFFARDVPRAETECQLPGRCGGFGVCEDSQCVACPSDSGQLLGWSRNCQPPRLTIAGSCKASGSSRYYKIEGVDHFLCKYAKGEEGIGERECQKKCSLDCKCAGYFYHSEISTCWLTPELGTLTRVPNSTHVGYIKTRA